MHLAHSPRPALRASVNTDAYWECHNVLGNCKLGQLLGAPLAQRATSTTSLALDSF